MYKVRVKHYGLRTDTGRCSSLDVRLAYSSRGIGRGSAFGRLLLAACTTVGSRPLAFASPADATCLLRTLSSRLGGALISFCKCLGNSTNYSKSYSRCRRLPFNRDVSHPTSPPLHPPSHSPVLSPGALIALPLYLSCLQSPPLQLMRAGVGHLGCPAFWCHCDQSIPLVSGH